MLFADAAHISLPGSRRVVFAKAIKTYI